MKWNPKLVIALSTAVALLGAQAKSLQAEPGGQCPATACPNAFGGGSCTAGTSAAELCENVASNHYPGCMASLQFAMCSSLVDCEGGLGTGAFCYWSAS